MKYTPKPDWHTALKLAWLLTLSLPLAAAPAPPMLLEDFEGPTNRWSFSPGAEFPGAKGRFFFSPQAAHAGKMGGRLEFDFSGGGNYVAAIFRVPTNVPTHLNALQFWVRRPEGHSLVFRYTDPTGQTLQKPVECPAGRWVRASVTFAQWSGHWGGANDGKIHGPPQQLALLIDNGETRQGVLDFDDLTLINADALIARVSWPAYQFTEAEGWRLRVDGNGGASRLEGRQWTLDFSQGARSIGLSLPERTLLGNVDRLRLRLRGDLQGHPVRLSVYTHFMTFHKELTRVPSTTGDGITEYVTDGPPGPGWEWYGGENDGKMHGPLRLGTLQVQAGNLRDQRTVELLEVRIDGSCPADKRCLLTADTREQQGRWQSTATLRALSETPLEGELTWVWRTWEGQEVARNRQKVRVPALGQPLEITVPLPRQTATKFLEAEFSVDLPGQDVPPVTTAWVAPLETRGEATLEPESLFGMGLYLYRYGGDARGLAQMEQAAQMARDAGVKWSREEFAWSRIEPRKGEFQWKFYDDMMACAKRNGITVYAIVCYWAPWTKAYTPEGVDDYVRYVQALVRRYGKDIKQWEIWNEPNIFFWQGPKEMYAELLKRSYAAIKELDPQAEVLGLSTAGIDYKFIDQMLALQAPFDILTIHPYRRVLKDTEFIADLKKASDKVMLPDGRRRPVWLTEMGWATFTPHNTLRQDFVPTTLRAQAELIARSYLCAIVSGVEPRTFWYNFRNDGEDPIYFEHQMGIVHRDFRPKPAYRAYAVLAGLLRGKVLERQLPMEGDTLAYTFKAKQGASRVTAVWNPLRDAQVTVPVDSAQVTLMNTMGESRRVAAPNGRCSVSLRKGAVLYLLH
ncbi:MAG: beta-galactosidase [Verrucomicrobiae bacterium]|nr:beta-galactosidase [Verrucomicrobiae bacterium]